MTRFSGSFRLVQAAIVLVVSCVHASSAWAVREAAIHVDVHDQAGGLFDISIPLVLNPATGTFSFDPAQYPNGFHTDIQGLAAIDVRADFALDPHINSILTLTNLTSSTLTFVASLTGPMTPVGAPNRVRASLSGDLTDTTGDGLEFGPGPLGTVQQFRLSADGGISFTSAGVDLGTTSVLLGSAPGPQTVHYGDFFSLNYPAGGIAGPGPSPGTWDALRIAYEFRLSGHDTAKLTAFAEIEPIPEPSTYVFICAGVALAGLIAARRKPK